MRQIKFRAWDKTEKYMDYEALAYNLISAINGNDDSLTAEEKLRYEVMQFTGLLDKNGKEIYEGDIIKNGIGEIYFVVWSDYGFCFKTRETENGFKMWHVKDYEHAHWSGPSISSNSNGLEIEEPQHYKDWAIEVIGNRYENPELCE